MASNKVYVIAEKNIPLRAPLYQTLVVGMVLDRFQAPQWLWGLIVMFFIFLWVGFFCARSIQEQVDVFLESDKDQ